MTRSHVQHMHESRHAYEWDMNESFHHSMNEQCHVRISDVKYKSYRRVTSHANLMSHTNESTNIKEQSQLSAAARIYMSHGTNANDS